MANERSTFIGGTSSDWANTANWDTADAPDSGDVAILNFMSGQAPVTSIGGQTAVALSGLIVQRGYRFGLGSAAAPMIISSDRLEVFGGTEFYYQDGDGTTTEVYLQGESNTLLYLLGSTYTNIMVVSGKLVLGATIGNVAQLIVGGMGLSPVVEILDNANTITDLIVRDGTVRASMPITRAHVAGGTLIQGGPDNTTTARAIATLRNVGGKVLYNSTATMTLADCDAGSTDFGNQAKTITTLRIGPSADVVVMDGGSFPVHTVTTKYDYRRRVA
jgi:hypothetical protein